MDQLSLAQVDRRCNAAMRSPLLERFRNGIACHIAASPALGRSLQQVRQVWQRARVTPEHFEEAKQAVDLAFDMMRITRDWSYNESAFALKRGEYKKLNAQIELTLSVHFPEIANPLARAAVHARVSKYITKAKYVFSRVAIGLGSLSMVSLLSRPSGQASFLDPTLLCTTLSGVALGALEFAELYLGPNTLIERDINQLPPSFAQV